MLIGLAAPGRAQDTVPLEVFTRAADRSDGEAREALKVLSQTWRSGYAAMVLELAELTSSLGLDPKSSPLDNAAQRPSPLNSRSAPSDPVEPPLAPSQNIGPRQPINQTADFEPSWRAASPVQERLARFLERQTGQRFGQDLGRWRQWVWSLPYEPHPDYASFKSLLYGKLDPRMREFFPSGVSSLIRLDEVEWGGVKVNGIPPLVYPKNIEAAALLKTHDQETLL